MHRLLKSLAGLACAFAAAVLPAHALMVSSVTANGNVVGTDFVGNDPLGVDVDLAGVDVGFNNSNPVSITFTVDQDDLLAGNVRFNSVVNMLTPGEFLRNILLTLDAGATFSFVGSVADIDGASGATSGSADELRIAFYPPTTAAFLGNPLPPSNAQDWIIDLSGLRSGDNFTLTMRSVDEPASMALVLAALGAAAWARRRRA